MGIYANEGTGRFNDNPQAVAYRLFTSNGTNNSANAVSLQVGQSFSVFVSLKDTTSRGINGNSVGFSLNNGTNFSNTSDYNTGSRFELSFTGGDSNAAIYDASSKTTSGLPNFTEFDDGRTYTFTLISSNEYNLTVSGGSSYNVRSLGGTSGNPLQSFSFFNRGFNNDDALFSNVSVANQSAIPFVANTGETKVVSGIVSNNDADGAGANPAVANSVVKSGAGTVQLTAANTYTGGTTVTAGTLLLGADNTLPTSTAPGATRGVTLAGGTLNANGTTQGSSGTQARIGALTLSADSTLQLTPGDTTQDLFFSDYARTNGTLTINGWSGSELGSGTAGRLFFSKNSFDSTELSQITFTGFSPGAALLSFDENFDQLTAVPEPSTWIGGAALLGVAGWRERRRLAVSWKSLTRTLA